MIPPLLRTMLLLLGIAVIGGCSTKRTITIASEPTGARVWVDGKERGCTPLVLPFVYYGDAEVRLEKPGYESLATVLVVPTQIDGYPVIDLPFELTVRRRHFEYKARLKRLQPETPDAAVEAIRGRATQLRDRTRREARPEMLRQPLGGARPPCPEAQPVDEPPRVVRSAPGAP